MAYTLKADAHVSQGLVVSRRGGPRFVRAVRLASYGRTSQCVWFAFDIVHSRLLNSYLGVGGASSTVRLGLLPAGARASVERLSASEGGAIRAFASADLTTSEGAETRLVGRRDGFYCRSGHSIGVEDDDTRARFRQIGALERDVTGARVSGGQPFGSR